MDLELTHIVLSDLHIGEEDSVLTPKIVKGNTFHELYPQWKPLADLFETLICRNPSQPTLVLLGDVIEFALSDPLESQRIFFEFLRYLKKVRGLFENIIYLPGNHDHHVWNMARQVQYICYLNRKGPVVLKEKPWHRTRALPTKDYHYVTPSFWQHLLDEGIPLKILYPNFLIYNEDTRHLMAFSHGHFLEPIYILLSRLKELIFDIKIPDNIDQLEEENAPWIEFLFSSFGFTGDVGKGAERFYELLQSQKSAETLFSGLTNRIIDEFSDRIRLAKIFHRPLLLVLKYLFRSKYKKFERKDTSDIVSDRLLSSIDWYVNGPLLNQFYEDLHSAAERTFVSKKLTFIFGHTHKPFFKNVSFKSMNIDIFNTGSLVVDQYESNHIYGTGIGLIDKKFGFGMFVSKNIWNISDYKANLSVVGNETFKKEFGRIIERKTSLKEFVIWLSKEKMKRAENLKERILKDGYPTIYKGSKSI